ncbi:MAG: KAP family NTPase [Acidobacteria bacterium]|nr:KAP family NTPase [Acidobacteriota bacterium]
MSASPDAEAPPPKVEVSAPVVVVKEGLAEDASARNAINDKPQDDVTQDTLGFRDYVFALREFIVSQDTTTPLTISINGQWGSGKSSMMRMLGRQLESPPPPGLWRVKLGWLWRWARGTALSLCGRLLAWSEHWDAEFIRLGLAFAPAEEVTDENFEELLGRHVEPSIAAQLRSQPPGALSPERLEKYRAAVTEKTRRWARAAALRLKMKPLAYPTVWFNAWKFNQQEQVWAALALAMLEQLRTKYGFFTRLFFLARLTYKRTDKLQTLHHLARKLLLPLALAAAAVAYRQSYELLKAQYARYFVLPANWAWLAPALVAAWKAWREIENPFRLPVGELVDQPDYEGKVGFIGTFEEDFGRIVEVAIRRSFFWQPRKLVIFIDDLDRCSPLQAASIIEAINLFLDSVGCVFVLGMDVAAVATSIEVKYKELTERMRRDAPDVLSPGSLFLDKIVQIPFNVPRPNKDYIDALVTSIAEPQPQTTPPALTPPVFTLPESPPPPPAQQTQPGALPADAPPARTTSPASELPKADRGSFAREDIKQAVVFASRLLKENPRQVKRFINLFRLQVYIADERGLLREEGDFGLTPKRLAVWVAWYMQWPEILKTLSASSGDGELLLNLRDITHKLTIDDRGRVGLRGSARDDYVAELKKVRLLAEDSPSHWSKLPWQVWLRDGDFLQCLKHLEPYWREEKLLDSIVDMTQFTVEAPTAAAGAQTPAVTSPSAS